MLKILETRERGQRAVKRREGRETEREREGPASVRGRCKLCAIKLGPGS